jgi:hypothetical protein
MSATIPRRILNPHGHTWSAVAALGLSGANSFLTAKGSIYNLAFVHEENCIDVSLPGCGSPSAIAAGTGWQDGVSNQVLAGKAPASDAVAAIDFAKLAHHVTRLSSAAVPGFHTLLYYSHLDLGEGLQSSTCLAGLLPCSIYAGPFQPYLVDVPVHTGPMPAVFWLHGVNANELSATDIPYSGDPTALVVMPFRRSAAPTGPRTCWTSTTTSRTGCRSTSTTWQWRAPRSVGWARSTWPSSTRGCSAGSSPRSAGTVASPRPTTLSPAVWRT